jgi:Sec-independent protein translocase protein TatA
VFGPRKLPELGSFLGKSLRDFRDSLDGRADDPGAGPPAHRSDASEARPSGDADARPSASDPGPDKRAD